MTGTTRIPAERIERTIYLIRGEKVMLDRDLAELYGSGYESAQASSQTKH